MSVLSFCEGGERVDNASTRTSGIILDELLPALGHIAEEEFGVRFCQGAEPDWSDKTEAAELIDEITESTAVFLKAQLEAYWKFGKELAKQERDTGLDNG